MNGGAGNRRDEAGDIGSGRRSGPHGTELRCVDVSADQHEFSDEREISGMTKHPTFDWAQAAKLGV